MERPIALSDSQLSDDQTYVVLQGSPALTPTFRTFRTFARENMVQETRLALGKANRMYLLFNIELVTPINGSLTTSGYGK